MPVKFTNPEVDNMYEALREKDGHIHIPAGKKTASNPEPKGYAGPLSGITPAAAEKAVKSGSNLLRLKGSNQSPASTNNASRDDE